MPVNLITNTNMENPIRFVFYVLRLNPNIYKKKEDRFSIWGNEVILSEI